MTSAEVKKKALKYHWDPWLERPFDVFSLSASRGSSSREMMRKIGIDLEMEFSVFERGGWYESEEVWEKGALDVRKYFSAGGSMRKFSARAEKFYQENKSKIKKISVSRGNILLKLKKIDEILEMVFAYIWATHVFEFVFNEMLNEEVPKFVKGDAQKFISDISFPKKKNKYALMIQAVRRGDSLEKVTKEFGWLKLRNALGDPFTAEDIRKEKKSLVADKVGKPLLVKIPRQLKALVDEVKELVYFRTFRTDMLYEFLFLARPIFKDVAKHYKVGLKDLKDCCLYDLAEGKFIRRRPNMVTYKKGIFFFDNPILPETKIGSQEVKGQIAFGGVVKGVVKIIKDPSETDKLKEGEILVSQMTFPSFILAMKRAAAFVTDEGGITCHAAIIAREMKKPCIIGTKIATKVLHDGDLVEVDADKGIVKILNKK